MVVQLTSASPAVTANIFAMDEVPEHTPQHCKYPSKKCWSLRVQKRNGTLHKFCEFHRQKANANQRRMEERRKELRSSRIVADARLSQATVINHAKHIMTTNPNGFDMPPETVRMDASVTPCDVVEADVGLDAAIDSLLLENDIEMEPSDRPVDLYEADLFFLEHFMTEMKVHPRNV